MKLNLTSSIPAPPPPRKVENRSSILPPPPPPKWAGHEPDWPPVSPDLAPADLEAAIWIHGGYPQVPWAQAASNLLAMCRATPLGHICAAAINILDRNLPTVNLTAETYQGRFDFAAKCEPNRLSTYQKGIK